MSLYQKFCVWLTIRECDRLKERIRRQHKQSGYMLSEADEPGIRLHEYVSAVVILVCVLIICVIGN